MKKIHVAVVGAGAFGGWTALALLRRGAAVTLFEAWGPGHSRSSSGGDTRVIRGMYGADALYAGWTARSFGLWRENEQRWGLCLYRKTGCLWMFAGDDVYARASLPLMAAAGLAVEELLPAEAGRRWPQVSLDGVRSVYYEPEAGYLLARRACRAVADAVVAEGGEMRRGILRPGPVEGGTMEGVLAEAGIERKVPFRADAYVFAGGPWLGRLFPAAVGERVRATRQEVFFFGPRPGDGRFEDDALPVWVDFGSFEGRIFYGIPGNEDRGFKVADDTRGGTIDPTETSRYLENEEGLARARAFLGRRFPDMLGAPLVESRVCQYENTPDGQLLVDRLPGAANTWIVGGGSGHGFKLAPALGEHVADLLLGHADPLPTLSLARLPQEPREKDRPQSQFATGSREL